MGQKLATVFRSLIVNILWAAYCQDSFPLNPVCVCVCGGCNDGSSLAQNYLPGQQKQKILGKNSVCLRVFLFFFPLYFYIFNSNQLVNRRGRERAEEQVSGCGHLKPCGSPDHHRPFHSTCSRSSSSSSSSSTQKSYYYNWLYKSPYKSSVCVCFYQTHTHTMGGRGWGEKEGKPRKE
jgi:hypothetical protein